MPAQPAAHWGLQWLILVQLPREFILYVARHIAMALRHIKGIQNQESVKSVSMPSCVNFRLHDVVIDMIEKSADARKQIFLVGGIDQYLDPGSGWCQPCLYDRHGRLDVLT